MDETAPQGMCKQQTVFFLFFLSSHVLRIDSRAYYGEHIGAKTVGSLADTL